MEQVAEEEVILEVSSGSEGVVPRVLGALTSELIGSVEEKNRLIEQQDVIGWNMGEGTVDPVVRATVCPPAEPATGFDSVEKLEATDEEYFTEGSERVTAGMTVGRWGIEQSLRWTHKRGFLVYEFLFKDLDVGLPFSQFEMDVLKHLNCSPAQLMSNGWRCLRFLEAATSWLKLNLSIKLFIYWFSQSL